MMATENESETKIDPAEVDALLVEIGGVPYIYREMKKFSETVDPANAVTQEALRRAIDQRLAEEFTRLYVACGMAGQLPGAWVLAGGCPIFTDISVLTTTILKLEGDLRGPILEAVKSGRLASEREATLLMSLWIWREREGITEVDKELLKIQRHSALNLRKQGEYGVGASLLEIVGAISEDSEMMRLMGYDPISRTEILAPSIEIYRKKLSAAIDWRTLLPNSLSGESLSAGATITRVAPRVGRNEPCHCGSGKKYKKCCASNDSSGSAYAIEGGQAIDEVKANPELLLNEYGVADLRSYELYQFDPHKLAPGILEIVVERLVLFRENARAREMLDAVPADRIDDLILGHLEIDFIEADDLESLRWVVERAGPERDPYFPVEITLAPLAEAIDLLLKKTRTAHQQLVDGEMARVSFTDIAQGAAAIDPSLGLIMARGVIPYVEWMHFELVRETIEACRIELGLTGCDPGIAWMDEEEDDSEREFEHRRELEEQKTEAEARVAKRKREAELLKTRLRSLQSELEKREKPVKGTRAQDEEPDPPTAFEQAKIEELREQARMLKGNLKQEHDDHARDRLALEQAQQELRRLQAKPAPQRSGAEADEAAKEALQLGESVEPMREARLPKYADSFERALAKFDNRIAANAIILAGKLAAADAHAWGGVRKLRSRPDTLRQRVGRDHRLLFKSDNDRIEFVDLINRRDLDDWIRRGG